jgi:predicted Fe-Mo cluster-binding NifX family protein
MPTTVLGIATTDGVSVCDHLARCAAAVVFEIEDGRIVSRTMRSRAANGCGNHRRFTDLLAGCHAAICGGIGQGAVDALAEQGTESIVLAQPMSIDDAAAAYVAGSLVTTDARTCLCG